MRTFKIVLLTMTLAFSGCGYLAVKMIPDEVKDSIAAGAAVASVSIVDEPSGKDLTAYLRANARLWIELANYFDVGEKNEIRRLLPNQ